MSDTDKSLLTSLETGEVSVVRTLNMWRSSQVDWSFIMMKLDGLKVISLDRKLSEADIRIYLWLASEATHELVVRTSQASIAESMGVDRSTVGRAIKRLVAGGYIQCLGKMYVLSPEYARRGSKKPKFWDDGGKA